jgi:hypothetical protein
MEHYKIMSRKFINDFEKIELSSKIIGLNTIPLLHYYKRKKT